VHQQVANRRVGKSVDISSFALFVSLLGNMAIMLISHISEGMFAIFLKQFPTLF
jgi:hypothetical protein